MCARSRLFPPPLGAVTLVTLLLIALSSTFPPGIPVAQAAANVASCAPDSGSATISGTVTAPGGVPISFAQVTAYTQYGDWGGSASTNASGSYTISGLIGGSYLLKFDGTGAYASEWYSNQSSATSATPVTVADGGAVSDINAELNPGARFSGTITGSGGGALQYVQVTVYNSAQEPVATADTDAGGAYLTSPGLPSGSYRIQFGGTRDYLGEWYNTKSSFETADPLTITAPTVQTGINAMLDRGGVISGRVTNAGGAPLAGITVVAGGQSGEGDATTDAGGNYTINGLPSGEYTVRARPSSDAANLVTTEQTVTVTAPGTTSNINFTMTSGATLSGRITDSSGMPLNNITVFIGNQDGSYQRYVYTNSSGNYTATALPTGSYKVLFRPADYIPEAYNNKPDFSQADSINVVAPGSVSGIDAALAKGSSLRGVVTDAATGLPLKDVFVEVLDSNGERVETADTQADGTYETNHTLPSGSYRVRFNADERFATCAYVTAYYNGKSTFESADLVVVSAPTDGTNINAQLKRGSIMFGKVTDATTGAPITNGQVSIYDASGGQVMFGRVTFLGGWHTVTGLPSGSYRVLFRDYDTGYIDEWYNNQSSLATATPVVLSAPTDRFDINAQLSRGAMISGHVTGADTGLPFTAGYVIVVNGAGNSVGFGSIATDGTYTVRDGLASGSYRVAVVPYSFEGEGQGLAARSSAATPLYAPTYYRGSRLPGAPVSVAVTAPNTTNNIDIAMLYGATIPLVKR